MMVIAIYEHRHGDDIRSFVSRAAAELWRQSLAQEFWDAEMPRPMPEAATPREIADQYFNFVDEFFVIRELEIARFEPEPANAISGIAASVAAALSAGVIVAMAAIAAFGRFQ